MENADQFPKGMTHQDGEPCPFKTDKNPIGLFGSCCSFRSNAAAILLFASGFAPFALSLFENKSPDECIAFAVALRKALDQYRSHLIRAGRERIEKVMTDEEIIEGLAVGVPDFDFKMPVTKFFQELESLADWYEKVGHMNFGVHAWY